MSSRDRPGYSFVNKEMNKPQFILFVSVDVVTSLINFSISSLVSLRLFLTSIKHFNFLHLKSRSPAAVFPLTSSIIASENVLSFSKFSTKFSPRLPFSILVPP